MNQDVQRFIDAIPEDRRPLFDQLQALVLELYPEAEVKISYGILMYKHGPGWVGLGYWKGGVSVYTNGAHHLAAFKAGHPEFKTGVGSIRFPVSKSLPVEAVISVIQHAMEGRTEP
jgi:uncharacterized protein YdhG (YjbR/CyaY superfamily)